MTPPESVAALTPARRARPLRRTLFLGFAGILLVMLGIAGIGGVIHEYHALKRAAAAQLETMALLTSLRVQSYLQAQQEAVALTAAQINEGVVTDPVAIERLLDRTRQTHTGLLTMLVTDAEGMVRVTSPDSKVQDKPRSVADREYFRFPSLRGRPIITDSFQGRGFGQAPLVAIAYPRFDDEGSFAGVVEASLDLARFTAMQDSPAGAGTAEVLLLDGAGQVVYASDQAHFPLLSKFAEAQRGLERLLGPGPNARADGEVRVSDGYTRIVSAAHTLHLESMGRPWRVVVFEPVESVIAEIAPQVLNLVFALLIGLACATLGAGYLAAKVTAPIQTLTAVSRVVASDETGTAHVPALPSSVREVGELAANLEVMNERHRAAMAQLRTSLARQESLASELAASRDSLASMNQALEERVAKRTEELRQSVANLESEVRARAEAEKVLELEKVAVEAVASELPLERIVAMVLAEIRASDPGCLPVVILGSLAKEDFRCLGATPEAEQAFRKVWKALPALFLRAEEVGKLVRSEDEPEWKDTVGRLEWEAKAVCVLPLVSSGGEKFGLLVVCRRMPVPASSLLRKVAETSLRLIRLACESERSRQQRLGLQEKLQHARRLEAVGTLAAGVAHCFNNLLVPVMGHAEMLRDALVPGTTPAKSAQAISKAAVRAAGLVRQLLAFARATKPVLEPVELGQLLQTVAREGRGQLPVGVTLALPPSTQAPVWVKADEGQILEVVSGMFKNACEAMHGRSGALRLAAYQVESAASPDSAASVRLMACIEISDEGCGIPAALRPKLFEPFFTTKRPEGIGLSLAFAHGCVAEHGGSIAVESEEGRGTTFRVFLPVALGRPGATPTPDGGTTATKALREILLVDDDPTVSDVTAAVLTKLGHTCALATSAEEALQLFQQREFDLVITDVELPGMDGVALVAEIERQRPTMAVLVLSGYGEGVRGRLSRRLRNRVLSKPFTYEQLRSAVQDALAGA